MFHLPLHGEIFRDLGYRIIYIGINKKQCSSNILDTKKEYFGFDAWEVPYPSSKKQWLSQILNPIGLEKIISQYENYPIYAVIPYNYPAIAQYKIKAICKKHNAYLIPDLTEWPASTGRGYISNIIKGLDTYFRMRVINFQSDALITVSPYLTKFYTKKIPHILELPTLYDKSSFKKPETEINSKNTSSISFLYAGTPFNLQATSVNRKKVKDRLDKIILLFKDMKKDFTLNIYGLTKDDYINIYPEHETIITNLTEHIFFHGRRSHTEIIKQVQLSDFTIFFRDKDRVTEAGFPSKFSESISCGTPVITNPMSNIKPHMKTGKTGFFINHGDQNEADTQIMSIMSLSQGEILNMKRFCFQSNVFDYKEYCDSTHNFFRSLEMAQTKKAEVL